ncbi:MAG TPA: chromate transporter [Candidatus Babeliales bacterium]|nr:chromate transporter [Candidatus Babeliales bacterium]
MSEAAAPSAPRESKRDVSLLEIFGEFLLIGATSFGGGVVAYLRDGLVRKKRWFDDVEFLELTSISNTLPGLNATNIAILAGDRLRGFAGAATALVAICLPAFLFMVVAGIIYGQPGARHSSGAALRGVAAAATGLLAATWFKIGKKSLSGFYDAVFVLAAVMGINYFKLGVPTVLIVVGALAIIAYRPRRTPQPAETEDEWIRSLH